MKTLILLISFLVIFTVEALAQDAFTLTPQAAASSLNIISNQTNLSIASASLGTSGTNKNPITYNLRVISQYGGLRNINAVANGATTAAATIPYVLNWATTSGSVNGQNALTINTTVSQTLMNKTDSSNGNSTTGGNILITSTGKSAASLFSGIYSDTLTLNWVNLTNNLTATRTLLITSIVIEDTITLVVTPTSSASNLPLTISQNNLNVGTISIASNCSNGYILQLSSAYSRQLRNTQYASAPQNNEKIDYTMTFNGTAVSPTTTPVTVASSSSATLLTSTTQIGNINISYTGVNATWKSGTYEDYLTFTLTSQ